MDTIKGKANDTGGSLDTETVGKDISACERDLRILNVLKSMLREIRERIRQVRKKHTTLERVRQLKSQCGKIRLDLGCGSVKRPGFIGLDISPNADIQWDISAGLPFDDNSVIEIRSDHFLEHLELPMVVEVLRECRRVLMPGGILDFTVPHADPYLDAYTHKDFDFMREKIFDVPQGQEELYNTCFDRIAWLLHRSGEHKSMFDKESILEKVRLAGFTKVWTREYDEKRDTNFRFSSIYVVAVK